MVGFFDGIYTTEVRHNLTFLGGADCRLSIATQPAKVGSPPIAAGTDVQPANPPKRLSKPIIAYRLS
jgi:hypothetical protein